MADEISFSAELDTGNFDAGMEILTGALRHVGTIAVDALFAAGAAVADFVGNSFAGAIEAEQGFARLTAQIEAQGDSAAVTAEQAAILADEYKHLAGGSDDAIIAAEAVLLKFNEIGSETFPQAIVASADLAALMGTDVASAAQLLGLALDDPTASLMRLDKATGAFTEAEKEQIKAMAEAGDVAGAQALILANLDEAIGGTAETLALTTAGQWAIFQETLADAGETIAGALLPAFNSLMQTVLLPILPMIEAVAGALGTFITTIVGGGDISAAFDALAGGIYRAFGPEAGLMVMQFGDFITGIYDFVAANWPLLQATFETVFTAIGGVMTVLSDFVTVTLMPAIASIWGESNVQLPTAQQTFEAVMAAIVVATQLVSDFITNILVPALTAAVDWVVTNWPAIQAKIEEVWAVMQAVFDIMVGYLTTVVIPIFASVVDWVVTNWPTIQATIEAVMTAVQAVINTVMSEVVPFVLEMFGQIKSWVDANWPLIQATIDTIMATISTNIHNVIDPLVAFWIANHETIQAVASVIWENMKLSIENAILFIEGVITATMQIITGDWEGAWTTIQTTLSAIWVNMQAATSNSMTAISAVVTTILSNLKTWWDAKWTEIQNSVTTILASILVTITTTVGNIAAAFDQDWPGLGMAIIGGIQSGIGSAVQGLVDAAVNAAIAAYNAALQALGIGSPSKLFAGIGKNVIESMGDSMTRATPMAMDAAHRAAQLISSAMQAGVIAPVAGSTNDLISPVSATRSPTGGSSTVSTTDARTYNLNATTDRTMQSVRSEFSTMQTLAGA